MFRFLPQISVAAAGIAGYTLAIHKHTFGADSHTKQLNYYKDEDVERPFDPNTKMIVDEMIDYSLLSLPAVDVARMNFFWSNLIDPSHHGTHYARFGTFIGVPVTFKYSSISEVDLSHLEKCGITFVDDNVAAIESLKEALVLSDDAKRFAMASQVKAVDTMYVIEKLSIFCCISGAYYMGSAFSSVTERLPNTAQLICFLAVVCVWTYIWYSIEKLYTIGRTLGADKSAAEMGQDYLKGGLEYLVKLRQRNIALRKLQLDGDKLYTEKGNRMRSVFEIPNASLTGREKQLLKLKSEASKRGLERIGSSELTSDQRKIEIIKQSRATDTIQQEPDSKETPSDLKEKIDNPGWLQKIVKLFI